MHWLIWLSGGIFLAILELFTPGFFLVGIGVSMAVASAVAALLLPFWLQLLVFGVCIALFFLFIRPLVAKLPSSERKSGTDAIIGKTGIVTEAVDALDGGRVKVSGEVWKASGCERIEKGEEITVVSIEGVTLTVRRK